MAEGSLQGCRILVVEDEYLLAADISRALMAAGAVVIGPAGTVGDARALLGGGGGGGSGSGSGSGSGGGAPDGAVLDINLHGDPVYGLADMLRDRGVPFVLVTGYDRSSVPDRYADAPHLAKPVEPGAVVRALQASIRPGVPAG